MCREFNLGKTETVISKYEFIQTKSVIDSKSYFLLETDLKFKGTVTQDVLTFPSSKKKKFKEKILIWSGFATIQIITIR